MVIGDLLAVTEDDLRIDELISNFRKVDSGKYWLRNGTGIGGGGDSIGRLIGTDIIVYMSWRGIKGKVTAPAFFKDFEGNWRIIPSKDVFKFVES